MIAVIVVLSIQPTTASASVAATYKGTGAVTIASGGNVPAWTWNDTSRTWSSTPIASATTVYIWPFASGWSWVWTSSTGWRAVNDSYVFATNEQRSIFVENFNGGANTPPDTSRWKVEKGPYGYAREACFNSRNAVTDGAGSLLLLGRKESSAGCTRKYTSGSIDGRQSFGPPRPGQIITFEARMKASCGSGQWPAFWTTGVGATWPTGGEIDMVEIYGNRPFQAAHDQHAPTSIGGKWHGAYRVNSATPWCNGFHTYGVRWSTGRLDYTIDGRITVSRARSDFQAGWLWPFDSYAQHLKLNLALGGDAPGAIDDSMLPSRTLFDWVQVTSN
jgi:beta-glucanase (GH16 family)